MTDLNKCPKCGGQNDNGHDRCDPPNPYECSCCHDEWQLQMIDDLIVINPVALTYDDRRWVIEKIKESIALRREKYKTEDRASNLVDILSREWCVKIYMHNEPMPSGCRSKTDEECHDCWMKELGF